MKQRKERIGLQDTGMDIIMKMSGGNPGAVNVLMQLMTRGGDIDPQSALGGLGSVLSLDTHKIYDEKIWMLYKDLCGEDIVTTVGLLRGIQLGIISESEVTTALAATYAKLPDGRVDEVLKQVRERLPAFAK